MTILYGWLSAGGPHFTGQWENRQGISATGSFEHAFTLQYTEPMPKEAKSCLPKFIRNFMKMCGWKAQGVSFNKGKMLVRLTPWPLAKQEEDRQTREVFRLAAIERREQMLRGLASNRTLAPSETTTRPLACIEPEDEEP